MRTLFSILLCGILFQLFAQNTSETLEKTSLTITVKNIKKIKGHVLVAVFDHESKFLKDFSIAKRKKVNGQEATFVFEDLPKGTYAISVFQDVNNNDKLDTNFLGIPKEPYGFSNNPSTFFGPPNFTKASFKIDTNMPKINIKL